MSFVCVNLYNAIHMFFYGFFLYLFLPLLYFWKINKLQKNHWAYHAERREMKKKKTHHNAEN